MENSSSLEACSRQSEKPMATLTIVAFAAVRSHRANSPRINQQANSVCVVVKFDISDLLSSSDGISEFLVASQGRS